MFSLQTFCNFIALKAKPKTHTTKKHNIYNQIIQNHYFMDKKLLYESPTIDVFTLQSEGVICTSMNGAMLLEDATVDDWGTL